MANIINTETFIAAESQPDHGYWVEGTVEVTLRGQTKTVPATKSNYDGMITARGLTGRYQSGAKAWPARVTQRLNPRTNEIWESAHFGRDDRAPKFQKMNGLHFA